MTVDRDGWVFGVMSGQVRGVRAGLVRTGLGTLSGLYGSAMSVRNVFYDLGTFRTHKPVVPVISVGNITLGGTGKTPFVEYLTRRLTDMGLRVALLSRGYAAEAGQENDEVRMLSGHLPAETVQLTGVDRVTLVDRAATERRSQVAVLDDGFQYRRLRRDLDVVLIDALNPFGYGHVFPRGLLREPLSGLRRADLFILTRADLVNDDELSRIQTRLAALVPEVPVLRSAFQVAYVENLADRARSRPQSLTERRVFAFCGIGNPDGFTRTLEQNSIRPVGRHVFPDHHHYRPDDLQSLQREAADLRAEIMVTTEKDAVKLPLEFARVFPLYWVRIRTRILAGEETLDRLLRRTLERKD